jgi:hypothetical protein
MGLRPAMKAFLRRFLPFPLRRAVWRVRRNVPRLAQPLSLALPRSPAPQRPIFVIGCPRSGTSALLELLLCSPELGWLHHEGHALWDPYHSLKGRGWDSDALGAEDVSERERAYVYLAVRMFVRDRRFIDKTTENCLRIGYLRELFPDATFVFLRRRAADNVNSLIEAWKARPRFVKYRLPERLEGIGEISGERWSFALIEGWRELRSAPLEEICARQYIACNEAVLDARHDVESSRWVDVAYEDLVASPVETAERLCVSLDLAFDPAIEEHAAAFHRRPSSTSLSAPRPDKWKQQNREAIERILPLTAPIERRLGYEP